MKELKVIAFDADDTLWVNESYFQQTEEKYCKLLLGYLPLEETSRELFKTEMQNISIYGYGIKSFVLSMIETALRISDNKVDNQAINTIIGWGKELLEMPVEVLPGVEDVLISLGEDYKLIVATKGDLLDQEKKLNRSGLKDYFHHVEIMSDKKVEDYNRLVNQLSCKPEEFLMIGNSLKSDILPVLEIGGYGAYIPFHVTWAHEKVEEEIENSKFIHLERITDIGKLLAVR